VPRYFRILEYLGVLAGPWRTRVLDMMSLDNMIEQTEKNAGHILRCFDEQVLTFLLYYMFSRLLVTTPLPFQPKPGYA
jgi:hypothetical protein